MTIVSHAIRRPVISVNFSIALSTIISGFKGLKIPNDERLIVYRVNNKADTNTPRIKGNYKHAYPSSNAPTQQVGQFICWLIILQVLHTYPYRQLVSFN
jgi:hypothetical protein